MEKGEVIFRVQDGMIYFSFVVKEDSFNEDFLERIESVLAIFIN